MPKKDGYVFPALPGRRGPAQGRPGLPVKCSTTSTPPAARAFLPPCRPALLDYGHRHPSRRWAKCTLATGALAYASPGLPERRFGGLSCPASCARHPSPASPGLRQTRNNLRRLVPSPAAPSPVLFRRGQGGAGPCSSARTYRPCNPYIPACRAWKAGLEAGVCCSLPVRGAQMPLPYPNSASLA